MPGDNDLDKGFRLGAWTVVPGHGEISDGSERYRLEPAAAAVSAKPAEPAPAPPETPEGSVRPLAAPAAVGAATVAVFAWRLFDPALVDEWLTAERAGLYLAPWRAISSGFVHYSVPHFLFNLATLWVFGTRVARRYGTTPFLAVFFAALATGQAAHTLLGPGHVYGISAGVCGLYGFLLRREWRGGIVAAMRESRPFAWYPAALALLWLADLAGLVPIANVNHLVGLATGWLMGIAMARGAALFARAVGMLPVATAALLLVFRPWDPVWQAVHGVADPDMFLPTIPCAQSPGLRGSDASTAQGLAVTLLNERRRRLVVAWYEPDGGTVELFRSAARARTFRPLAGSFWRVSDESGCVLQFAALKDGVVRVDR